VLIGDNNTGKTTILEALDLALGPDRLNRLPPVDEHDFFLGAYSPVPRAEANGGEADLANEDGKDLPENECEIPEWLRDSARKLKSACEHAHPVAENPAAAQKAATNGSE